MIYKKMKALEWSKHFSHNKSRGFLRRSRAANSTVQGLIRLNFEPIKVFITIIGNGILKKYKLIQALMVVLLICKNEEDQFKNESTKVGTTDLPLRSMGIFPDAQGQLTPQSKV